MTTGQLCSEGTSAVLRVDGKTREQWVTAARKYNKAVGAATEQLMKDARDILTPDQMVELTTWFEKGFNTQINQLLAQKAPQNTP